MTTIADFMTKAVGVELLSVAGLGVDSAYQRTICKARIKKMARAFNHLALGVVHVSRREDGTCWVMDGQHRVALCEAVGHPTISCLVYEGLSVRDEAELFSLLNNYGAVRQIEKLRAAIAAGEPAAVQIGQACLAAGYTVGTSILCARAIQRVCGDFGHVSLTTALLAIADAFDGLRDPHGVLVGGVGWLVGNNPVTLDFSRLVSSLKARTPSDWVAQSNMLKAGYETLSDSLAAVVGTEYNKRLSPRNRIKHPGVGGA